MARTHSVLSTSTGSSASEKDDRQRDLGNDEQSTGANGASTEHGARASLLERVEQIDLRRVERRNQSEQQTRGARNDQGECGHAAVDAGWGEPDHVGRSQRQQRSCSLVGQQQSVSACDEGQQKTFGDQLPDDATAIGAEHRANRDLSSGTSRVSRPTANRLCPVRLVDRVVCGSHTSVWLGN